MPGVVLLSGLVLVIAALLPPGRAPQHALYFTDILPALLALGAGQVCSSCPASLSPWLEPGPRNLVWLLVWQTSPSNSARRLVSPF